MRPLRSNLSGGLRIGSDFFERRGVLGQEEARGVVDRIADLSHPGLDLARIPPAVVPFFEDTVGLDLAIESRWRFPFSLLWRIARPVMRWIGQFALPLRQARIVTRGRTLVGDLRPNARAIVRLYEDSGEAMQAVAYATWTDGASSYMSAAFPLPGGQMLGILRLDHLGENAVVLTSSPRGAGVWIVLGPLMLPSPFGERLELWTANAPGAPKISMPDASITGRHEQSLFGIRFVTHLYGFRAGRALPSKT